jgi:hypothetical protein
LQKQYWVVKPNVAKPILGCETQHCKSNIGLQPNIAKAILGCETQPCKSNIGLQPNVSKAILVATQCFKSNIGLQHPALQKKHRATNPKLQRKTDMLQPNVAL